MSSSVALVTSSATQPPSGSGHGVSTGSPSSRGEGWNGPASIRVNEEPSYVPTTWNAPHVVPDADSSPSTEPQSQFSMGTSPHCGGYESAMPPRQSIGPWSGLSRTVVSASYSEDASTEPPGPAGGRSAHETESRSAQAKGAILIG